MIFQEISSRDNIFKSNYTKLYIVFYNKKSDYFIVSTPYIIEMAECPRPRLGFSWKIFHYIIFIASILTLYPQPRTFGLYSYIIHALTREGHLFDRYMRQHGVN